MPIKHIDIKQGASDYPEALSHHNNQPPIYRVILWPHRSLPCGGFVLFIALTSALLTLPLMALFGTAALWVMLPFLAGTITLLWFFIMRSYKSGHLVEELSLWPDKMTLVRSTPYGPVNQRRQNWDANPFWVEVVSHDKPLPNYLTLRGGPREVELGSFLTPEEREMLKQEIEERLRFLMVPKPSF